MQKIFISIFVLAVYLIPVQVGAQGSCRPVTKDTYNACCTGVGASGANAADCRAYLGGYSQADPSTPTTPTTSDPGMQCNTIYSANRDYCCGTFYTENKARCDAYDHGYGGIQGTLNSGGSVPPVTIINSSGSTQIAGSSPQSGAAELNQCSKITFNSLFDILIWIKCIILVAIIPLMFAAAFIIFLWGVLRFMAAADSTKKDEGKKLIMAGLIGLFVMTSVWGIIKIVSTTLGIDASVVPALQTKSK